ncbi:MAG: hypothetical protein IJC76_06970 [Lachnospiraceae bacterium]|nr:hypothetical protein [Lachnospiraceae bacterium]
MIREYIKDLLKALLSILRSRVFFLCILFGAMFSILIIRIFNLQIVNKDYYLNNYIQKGEREISVSGTRGLIYDRNGKVLAYNELAYAVTIEDVLASSSSKSDTLNEIIYNTIKIIEDNGDSINNEFSIIIDSNGNFVYSVSSEAARLRFLRDIYGKKSVEELDTEKEQLSLSTAKDVYDYLTGEDRFDISDEYSDEMRLKIAIIRYNLSLNSYQKYISTTIASNVSEKTVAAIYENESVLSGVAISEETIRVYKDSVYFAHILGYTGKISEDQLSEYNTTTNGNYEANDIVGKSGIEYYMEENLQGIKGKQTLFVNSTGKTLEIVEETDASAGKDVYLTLDSEYQIAAYKILEQKLAGILYSKIVNSDFEATEDSDIIYIPIKDVYFQMINNNVVDLNKFNRKNASNNEKNVYAKFVDRQNMVISDMKTELTRDDAVALKYLSEEYNTYLSYIEDMLRDNKIIDTSSIDTSDEVYIKWTKEEISLQEYLKYAISKNWVKTVNLISNENNKYSGTDEIYNALIEYIRTELINDTSFSKKIYKYLIKNGTISGNEICMLLFDQKVLKYDSSSYQALASGQQTVAYNFMMEQIRLINITPAQIALDPCSGSIVVTDTDTGDVLALVTYPSYDNNKLSGTVDAEYWNKLNNDLSLPLYNRATQTRTAPGSTFKMVSGITGLEHDIITPQTCIHDNGEFKSLGQPFPKCWRYPGSHGSINVSQALCYSCNYFFYSVGFDLSINSKGQYDEEVGLKKLEKYATDLGLNMVSGIELDENPPLFSTSDAVRSSIGQGSNSYANIQLARYTNTIANSGKNYELTLIDKIVDNSNNKTTIMEPKLTNTVELRDTTWDAIHHGMRLVITSGTAAGTFRGFNIEVAGKSGTAQENKLRSNHTVFVAYAPYEEPEVAMSVLIPYGDSTGYSAEIIKEFTAFYYGLTSFEEIIEGTATVPTAGHSNDN